MLWHYGLWRIQGSGTNLKKFSPKHNQICVLKNEYRVRDLHTQDKRLAQCLNISFKSISFHFKIHTFIFNWDISFNEETVIVGYVQCEKTHFLKCDLIFLGSV